MSYFFMIIRTIQFCGDFGRAAVVVPLVSGPAGPGFGVVDSFWRDASPGLVQGRGVARAAQRFAVGPTYPFIWDQRNREERERQQPPAQVPLYRDPPPPPPPSPWDRDEPKRRDDDGDGGVAIVDYTV